MVTNVSAGDPHPDPEDPTETEDPVKKVDVELRLSPPAAASQGVVLLLNELDPPADRPARAYTFEASSREDGENAGAITVVTEDVTPGKYLVRAQVEGAESVLEVADAENPDGVEEGRYAGPTVKMP